MDEKVIHAFIVHKPKLFSKETYTLVLPERCMIVAQMTAGMLKVAAAQAQ